MADNWTPLLVADRLREAADTLWRLPLKHPGRRITSSWPEIVRNFKDIKGFTDPGRPVVRPSPQAIDRMDEVLLDWFLWLEPGEVKILWSWMARIPAPASAARLGVSRSTLLRRRAAALKKLAVLLNLEGWPISIVR